MKEYNLKQQEYNATYNSPKYTDGGAAQSNQLYTANKSAILHNNKAMEYVDNNISKVAIKNGGITEAALEAALQKGLKNGTLTNSDVDKVLKTFGL
jgi:hypothetical protein